MTIYEFIAMHRAGFAGMMFLPARKGKTQTTGYRIHPGRVAFSIPGSPAQKAGIQIGDEIVEVNGIPAYDVERLTNLAASSRRGSVITYRVKRDSDSGTVRIKLASPLADPSCATGLAVNCVLALAFAVTGFFVFAKKPADRRAFVFLLLCAFAGASLLTSAVAFYGYFDSLGMSEHTLRPAMILTIAGLFTAIPVLLHFAVVFPKESPVVLKWPELVTWIYALPASLFVAGAGVIPLVLLGRRVEPAIVVSAAAGFLLFLCRRAIARGQGWRALVRHPYLSLAACLATFWALAGWVTWLHHILGLRTSIGFLLFFGTQALTFGASVLVGGLAYPVLACVALFKSYFRSTLEEKRQLAWPLWGITVPTAGKLAFGLANMGLYATVGPALMQHTSYIIAGQLATASGILIPLSIGIAILKYRLMDIEIVIRRTLLYGFLTGFVIVSYLSLVGALGGMAVRTAGISSESFTIVSTLAIAAGCYPVKNWAQVRLNRRFLGARRSFASALSGMARGATSAEGLAPLMNGFTEILQQAVQARAVAIWTRSADMGRYAPTAKVGLPDEFLQTPAVELPAAGGIVDFERAELPAEAERVLRAAGCKLLVGAGNEDNTEAWIALGGKLLGGDYNAEDREFLTAAAQQLVLGLRQVRLRDERRDFDRLRREVLARVSSSDLNLVKECPLCGVCYDREVSRCPADCRGLTIALPVERAVDGKYRLERRLGTGGMGAVYEATDLRLLRKVAVKVMLGKWFGNRDALRRFEREARTVAALRHPNIVSLFDFGQIGSDGAYLVMERLYGNNWRAEMVRGGAPAGARAAIWFDQLLSGLETAHAAGVVHRDLKPENVFVAPGEGGRDHITILDFGVAKARVSVAEETGSLTAAGAVVGTPGYMAPEQLAGGEAGERTDIYAAGVMLVETLSAQRPRGQDLPERWRERVFSAEGGPELDRIARKCLAADPGDRFRNVVEFHAPLIAALEQYGTQDGEEIRAGEIETEALRPEIRWDDAPGIGALPDHGSGGSHRASGAQR
jgi:hypothetical protein